MDTRWTLIITIVQAVVVSLIAFLIRMYQQDTRSEAEEIISAALRRFVQKHFPTLMRDRT